MTHAPESKKTSTLEFVKNKLSLNPEATFQEIKALGKLEGILVYPVLYGRAKALLGLVRMAPYGSRVKSREREATELRDENDVNEAEDEDLAPEQARAVEKSKGASSRLVQTDEAGLPVERKVAEAEHVQGTERAIQEPPIPEVSPRTKIKQAVAKRLTDVEPLLESIERIVEERDRYRATLEKIRAAVEAELE